MGDAVLRVRGHLRSLALENWSALEEQHARNVSKLRDELAQISRALEIKARFETKPVVAAAYPRAQENVVETVEHTRKKQKIENPAEDVEDGAQKEERDKKRLSMRLRPRANSADIIAETAPKKRKRGRPSEGLLRDPGKLTVVDLRSELKKRGLRSSGLKAVLFDRLLDALMEEQKGTHMRKVDEEQEVIVIADEDEDEIVRESVGSNKSPRSGESQSTSKVGEGRESRAEDTTDEVEASRRASQPSTDVYNTGRSMRTNSAQDTAEVAPEPDTTNDKEPTIASETNADQTDHSSKHGVEFTVKDGTEEMITNAPKETRKSMQITGKSELTSPLGWKRKSILRKASSLAPSVRPARNVSFAPTDMVDVIVESSQTDSSQPDPSPEKAPSSNEAHIHEENVDEVSESVPKTVVKPRAENTTVAPSSVPTENPSTPSIREQETEEQPRTRELPRTENTTVTPSISTQDPSTPSVHEHETEEQRRKREFDESVQREAQKLRASAILSAKKRLEEAKATKAFWAKRDQLKAKLRASSAGDKRKSSRTPGSLSKPASDQISPPISEVSTATDSDTNRLTTSASKDNTQTQQSIVSPHQDAEEVKDHDLKRSMPRQQDLESITNVSSAFESSIHEIEMQLVVEEDHQVERTMTHRLAGKPLYNSKETQQYQPAGLDIEQLSKPESHRQVDDSSILSPTTSLKESVQKTTTLAQVDEVLSTRDRSDSLSSTVSSIHEPSVVENALRSGNSTDINGNRKPIANLVSGLHSFTTLLQKDNSQASTSNRSAPVVNALKLAERSRVAEEKKRLEKEKRKAILKKKMEEHKKAAALKEKAVKDAQAKREQDRLNERKKREAELARRRQQKLKEMRAGLEKKRAMLAAEKKSVLASAMSSKSAVSTTAAPQHKHRGLASASESSQPTAKPKPPLHKPTSKPMVKAASSKAPVSKSAPVTTKPPPKPVTKSVPRPALASPVPTKNVPMMKSPEIVNYEMSDNAESDSDSDSERHGKKKVPRWAQKDHLNKILHAQFGKKAIDPSPAIFEDFVDTCNLEAIFETTDVRKKKKFTRRTSSGNWLADRPTARDRALYQRDMGYDR